MAIFLRFMGWLILWSLLYFSILDFMGLAPGKDPKVVSGIILLASFPIWWFTWKKFENSFWAREPQDLDDGKTAYFFSLRNPALMYYLMVLKLFLLAMGANGIITLEHYKGGWRTFYIWNFIILYIYAIPFFVIKFKKLKKALACRLVVDDKKLCLQQGSEMVSEIAFDAIDRVTIEKQALGMFIESGDTKMYVGGRQAKGSGFYTEGAETICSKIEAAAGGKVQTVEAIKETLKSAGFKPVV